MSVAALLKAGVVVHRHPRELRHLLSTQAGDPAVRARRQPDVFWPGAGPTCLEVLAQLSGCSHTLSLRQATTWRGTEGGRAIPRYDEASYRGLVRPGRWLVRSCGRTAPALDKGKGMESELPH